MKKDKFDCENPAKQDCELFSNANIKEFFELPKSLPDISQILSVMAEYEVISQRTIQSVQGLSYEGYYFSGKKVVIGLKFKQKILYKSTEDTQSIHLAENETYQCVYIVIPVMIQGTDPEFLIAQKLLRSEVEIEETSFEQIDNRNIYICISVFAKLFLLSTYELCCALHKNSKNSSIYLTNEMGTTNSSIKFNNKCKCIKPKWSPRGTEVAFLSDYEGKFAVYIYFTKTDTTQRITDCEIINSINSFDWSSDSNKLFFSASINSNKEIFCIDIINRNHQQLTRGSGMYNSFGPRCSLDLENIVFLRSISGIVDLWMCNIEGKNLRKITSCGYVRCFDYISEEDMVAFVKGNDGKADELYLLDIMNQKICKMSIDTSIVNIKSVRISKDCHSIAFIGSDLFSQNVFLYDLDEDVTTNLTKHQSGVEVGDFDWKADSSRIYYSSNESFYYNIYVVHIKTKLKKQLTNSTFEHIELAYRPKIG